MQQALVNMLRMQDRMNMRVHDSWQRQGFAWYRAIWIECAELIEHHGYKWWKKQEADMEQVRLEVIDIWHFGLSALLRDGKSFEQIASEVVSELADHQPDRSGVPEATEKLALHALSEKKFSPTKFWDLMLAAGLEFDTLYAAYVGKNVLNFFRQDNGYKTGTYIKTWAGREDNEHLVELVGSLDKDATDFADQVYRALQDRYRELVLRP
ncbi:MAG: dUTP diphosphatase [Halioglobus sp.]|nr:dUTP diphosphatase [Halioglobus sp.]